MTDTPIRTAPRRHEGGINCYRTRSWQRRAETICRKLDDLLDDIRKEIEPDTALELSILNLTARLVDESDMLVVNLDALSVEVSR